VLRPFIGRAAGFGVGAAHGEAAAAMGSMSKVTFVFGMVSVYGAAAGASARPAMGEPRSSVPRLPRRWLVISQ
jgi:hypothetical protein